MDDEDKMLGRIVVISDSAEVEPEPRFREFLQTQLELVTVEDKPFRQRRKVPTKRPFN